MPARHRAQIEDLAEVRFVVRQGAPDADDAVQILDQATVLATTNITLPHLDDALLERLPRLRSVVLYATGFEHVDLAALNRHGVRLSILPGYATGAVAEHALALLMAMATRTHLANDKARGLVVPGTSLRGVELGGRTLGIIGVGRIGSHLARIATGLGMTVAGSDIDPIARRAAEEAGITMVQTEELLTRADAVAVCASTDPRRPTILDARSVARMRRGAFLVNIGRPGLVDTPAIVGALRSQRLRGYAVDDIVFDRDAHADLISEGRVLQTSHSAWWRDEVLERGSDHFGRALLEAVRGRPVDVVTSPPEDASLPFASVKEQVA